MEYILINKKNKKGLKMKYKIMNKEEVLKNLRDAGLTIGIFTDGAHYTITQQKDGYVRLDPEPGVGGEPFLMDKREFDELVERDN